MTNREYTTRARYLASQNSQYPPHLIELAKAEWPKGDLLFGPVRVLRSRDFLVQQFAEKRGAMRLSICRTMIDRAGEWFEEITWDDLQELKRQAGFTDRFAVEIYPADAHIVNVANMRHLWLLPEAPAFAWKQVGVVGGGAAC